MIKEAVLSNCENYRYSLTRIWDCSKGKVLFIMLNPSTADANNDDPTITRCINYCKSWGFGGLYVVNLFPFRSKEPGDLLKCENPLGENNSYWIKVAALKSDIIICAWGNSPIVNKLTKKFPNHRPLDTIRIHEMCYLELSKDGTPKHPLYLLKSLNPKSWHSIF
jgi:hypothetical protein